MTTREAIASKNKPQNINIEISWSLLILSGLSFKLFNLCYQSNYLKTRLKEEYRSILKISTREYPNNHRLELLALGDPT